MAHNLTISNGKAEMFSAGSASVWHGLGQRSASAVTWDEAQKLAGLDWEVEKRKLFDQYGHELPAHGTFRTDKTGADGFLGTVGEGYEIIQNGKIGEVLDSVVGVENGAHYETAGSINGGRRVWALLKLPTAIKVRDDISENYLFMSNSHDGSSRAIVKLSSTRIVCQNTLSIALKDAGSFFKISHTKSAISRSDAAMAAVRAVNTQIVTLNDIFNDLANKQMSSDEFKIYLETLFPEKLNKKGDESTENRNKKALVTAIFENNDNDAYVDQRGTYYNALNAVTNYVDHHASAKGDADTNRAVSAMYGAGFVLKMLAISEITRMAGISSSAISKVI